MDEKSKGVHNSGKLRQCIVAIIVNLSTIACGISHGWASPVIPQLRSANPPVGHDRAPISDDQISWITGLLSIGALVSVPFSGALSEKFGRKAFGYIAGVPLIASWLLVAFGTSHVYLLYVARFVAGLGASMSMFIVPLYVSEIANEEVRGALGSLLLFSAKMGIFIAYVAGAHLTYRLFAAVALIFPVAFVVAFFFLPETPVYLVRNNRLIEAERSLMFFKANNREFVERELARLKSHRAPNDSSAGNDSTKGIINLFARLFRDRATRRGLTISLVLITGQQFSGIFAMINYAEPIFKIASSPLSAASSSIMIGAIQVVSSYTSTLLMERAGRRLLSLVSCLGMTLSHCAIGAYLWFHDRGHDLTSISWLPLVAFSTFMVSYCLGMGPVPFVVISEVFSNDVSSFASTVCYVYFWAAAFVVLKMFAVAVELVGGGCFFVFAAFCAACFAFCCSSLPETKGRKREDIVRELAGDDGTSDGDDDRAEAEDLMTTKPVV